MYSFTCESQSKSMQEMRQAMEYMDRKIRAVLEEKSRIVEEINANKRIEADKKRIDGEKEVYNRIYAFL